MVCGSRGTDFRRPPPHRPEFGKPCLPNPGIMHEAHEARVCRVDRQGGRATGTHAGFEVTEILVVPEGDDVVRFHDWRRAFLCELLVTRPTSSKNGVYCLAFCRRSQKQ